MVSGIVAPSPPGQPLPPAPSCCMLGPTCCRTLAPQAGTGSDEVQSLLGTSDGDGLDECERPPNSSNTGGIVDGTEDSGDKLAPDPPDPPPKDSVNIQSTAVRKVQPQDSILGAGGFLQSAKKICFVKDRP